MKLGFTLVSAVLSLIVLSGCSSNDALIQKQGENIETLNLQVNVLAEKISTIEQSNTGLVHAVSEVEQQNAYLLKKSSYIIKEGDNLTSIASELETTVDALLKKNPQMNISDKLLIGHVINI